MPRGESGLEIGVPRSIHMRRRWATLAKWQARQAPVAPAPAVESWRAWPAAADGLGPPVHLDKHVVCLSKPAGLLSQPDISGEKCASQLASQWLGARASCVHRLDKWATGCLLLARTPRAATRLSVAFEQKRVSKRYLVIVQAKRGTALPRDGTLGHVERHLSCDRGGKVHVDWPTSRHVKHRHAALGWRALATERGSDARHALLCVSLRGGFKHQIRALLGAEGLPLLGDVAYGGDAMHTHPSLIALHAATLQLDHPIRARQGTMPRTASEGLRRPPKPAPKGTLPPPNDPRPHASALPRGPQGFAPLLLCAPLPEEWQRHAPRGMVDAARRLLGAPVGIGPLWEQDAPEPEGTT